MSEEEKKPEIEEEEAVQSSEQADSDTEFVKKELSEEEEKEIFGDDEKTETEEVLEIYREKEAYEIEFHKKFGKFPDEWIHTEVTMLMKSDHALVRNWKQINEWIKEIAIKLNSAVVLARAVREFCPAKCSNPIDIDEGVYAFAIADGDTIDHVIQECLTCPLFPYGTVNAFDHRPEEIYSEYQIGKSIKELNTKAEEERLKDVTEEEPESEEPESDE